MVKTSSSTHSARSRVWAEPCLIEAAKKEYDGVIEEFLAVGEKLFGPYVWGRYQRPSFSRRALFPGAGEGASLCPQPRHRRRCV